MLGPSGSAYERMALPFRDIEDAVGTFGTLGALRHALSLFAGTALEQTEALGAIMALVAVYAAGAEAVIGSLDDGQLHTRNAALVGLRVLAGDIVARLRSLAEQAPIANILADLEATQSIARGPRLARQTQLGADAIRALRNP